MNVVKKVVIIFFIIVSIFLVVFYTTIGNKHIILPIANLYLKHKFTEHRLILTYIKLSLDYIECKGNIDKTLHFEANGRVKWIGLNFNLSYKSWGDFIEIKDRKYMTHIDIKGYFYGTPSSFYTLGDGLYANESPLSYRLWFGDGKIYGVKTKVSNVKLSNLFILAGKEPKVEGRVYMEVDIPHNGQNSSKIVSKYIPKIINISNGKYIVRVSHLRLFHPNRRVASLGYFVALDGELNSSKEDKNNLKIDGEAQLFDGRVSYKYNNSDLNLTVNRLNARKIQNFLELPPFLVGKHSPINGDINFTSIQPLNGNFQVSFNSLLNLKRFKKLKFLGNTINFYTKSSGDIKNNIVYSQTSISTKLADILLSNAKTKIPSGFSSASYRLKLLRIDWLKAITHRRYIGIGDITGHISWDGKLHIDGPHLELVRSIFSAFFPNIRNSDSIFRNINNGILDTIRRVKYPLKHSIRRVKHPFKHLWNRIFK